MQQPQGTSENNFLVIAPLPLQIHDLCPFPAIIQITIFSDCIRELRNLALVHYTLNCEEHSVVPHPHWNSKKGGGYIPHYQHHSCRILLVDCQGHSGLSLTITWYFSLHPCSALQTNFCGLLCLSFCSHSSWRLSTTTPNSCMHKSSLLDSRTHPLKHNPFETSYSLNKAFLEMQVFSCCSV